MTDAEIAVMSSTDKVGEAMQRAIPKLPSDAGAALRAMLTAENLAIMAGVIVVWAGSHVVGVGAIVDVLLLGAGVILLGCSAGRCSRARKNFTILRRHPSAPDPNAISKLRRIISQRRCSFSAWR